MVCQKELLTTSRYELSTFEMRTFGYVCRSVARYLGTHACAAASVLLFFPAARCGRVSDQSQSGEA